IVVDISAGGEVFQLLPNAFTAVHQVARVSSGTELTIPAPDYGFVFKATEPKGEGQLIALVVPETFPQQAITAEQFRARTFGPVHTPTSYLMNLVQYVKSAMGDRSTGDRDTSSWGFGVTDYAIVE